MLITIKYFGQIAEITGKEEELLEVSKSTIEQLLKELYRKYIALEYKNFKVAQNQALVPLNTLLTGQEIALLPPFSGG